MIVLPWPRSRTRTWSNTTSQETSAAETLACSTFTSGASRNSKTRSAAAAICCRMLETCASWVIGCVKFLTYWMNAWMSPTVMMPCTAKKLPRIATAT